MPSCSTATNPNGVSITFEEDTHKYWSIVDGKRIDYISGTQLIHSYFPQFDADKIAPYSARKLGISVEEVKAKWAEAGNVASRYGTRVHEICEDTILQRELRNTPENEKEELTFKHAIDYATKIFKKSEIVGVEKIVFNEKLRIAGTIDLLVKLKNSMKYYILDWKTNKEIAMTNKYNEHGFGPCEDLMNCSFYHYSLQLSLYQYLLRYNEIIPAYADCDMALIHLTPAGAKPIRVKNLGMTIRDIVIDHLTK